MRHDRTHVNNKPCLSRGLTVCVGATTAQAPISVALTSLSAIRGGEQAPLPPRRLSDTRSLSDTQYTVAAEGR